MSETLFIDDMDLFYRVKDELRGADDKKLLWLLMESSLASNELFSAEAALVDTLQERLYPEFDGENVKMTDYGWETPEGPIIYVPSLYRAAR